RQTWLAENIQSQKNVIVKLLPFSPQTQWQDIKLFEREAQVLQHLDLPRIPRYLDYFSVEKELGGGLPWFALVQDYIPGSSLQDLLKTGKKFTEAGAKDIAKQLLEILIDLHELSPPVLHRDLKPSNIIKGKNGKIYLVDFGAVQEKARAEGVTFTVVGTGGYAPPEQLWGRAVAASDLYALGATLVHLLTGVAPGELPQRRMRLQFRDKAKGSPEFARWLDKLLDPAVERRFVSARQALAALERQESTPKVRYGRLGGLALLQYGTVGLCALALPMFAAYRYMNEGKINVESMNRAQQAYFLEEDEFSNSLKELSLGIPDSTENYDYSIRKTPLYAFNYANPRKAGIRGYVGIVVLSGGDDIPGETLTIAATCEKKETSPSSIVDPQILNGVVYCPTGTRKLRGYEKVPTSQGILIKGKDWQLAYQALRYARVGQGNRAVGQIQKISDPSIQARALKAIAPYLKTGQQSEVFLKIMTYLQSKGDESDLLETLLEGSTDPQLLEEAEALIEILKHDTDLEALIDILEDTERDR
ncbi:MAG: type IV pilin-like G/H family protein, partial [Cyanobacteriota bacterium]|nr:type IV pilin-like G/H family protein [Cyanobacteriota bacterium]